MATIAVGGVLGAAARYGVARLLPVSPGTIPWATFLTNVAGSFALGVVLVLIVARFPTRRYLRPFLATGFLGAFTTYSTFAVESVLLVKDGHAVGGVAYAAASLAAGFLAAWGGIALARTGLRRGPGS